MLEQRGGCNSDVRAEGDVAQMVKRLFVFSPGQPETTRRVWLPDDGGR